MPEGFKVMSYELRAFNYFPASKLDSLLSNKMDKEKYILLTIDVEDWFQVENFKPWIPFETWDQRELRVERNVHRLLNLFDSVELKAPRFNRFQHSTAQA